MKTILITGATSGIGLALAKQLTHTRLILVGRRDLETLSDPIFTTETYCQADLAEESCGETIADWLNARGITKIDTLIHNAGVGWSGALWEQTEASIRGMVQVNLTAPVIITHHLLPHIKHAKGQIAFVSSVVSTVPAPSYAVYCATKKALDGFARSLRIELGKSATVQVFHPGATRTAMPEKVGTPKAQYEKYRSAESVATEIIKSLNRPRRNTAIGLNNKGLRAVSRLAPRLISAGMSRSAPSLPKPLPKPSAPKRVLITGAADGIGKALAIKYGSAGYHVVGVDVDAIRALATHTSLKTSGFSAEFRTTDLIKDKMDWLDTLQPFDCVIHNAGISAVGRFGEIPLRDQLNVIKLNFLAPLLLTNRLLQNNQLTQNSAVLFLSSLSAFVSYPGAAVYSATKDGLESYSRSLRSSLTPAVSTTTIFPGPTRTEHARRYSPDNSNESSRMSPAHLADLIYDAHHAKKRQLLPGGGAKASAVLGTVAPRLAEFAMKKALFDKMPS